MLNSFQQLKIPLVIALCGIFFVEKTHFALSWIYIHCKEYEKAREHIAKLPSIKSNMLKESILAKLEGYENGVEAIAPR